MGKKKWTTMKNGIKTQETESDVEREKLYTFLSESFVLTKK